MNKLPRAIHEGGYEEIEKESLKAEERAKKGGSVAWDEFSKDLQAQQIFLDCFRETFHVTRSRQMAGVEYRTYQKWRRTSISFVKSFNEIIEEWHDDIFTTAAMKARGHYRKDEETDSGYVEDAEGNPIRHGVDANMNRTFLKAMYPESFGDRLDMNMNGNLAVTSDPLTPDQREKLDRFLEDEY